MITRRSLLAVVAGALYGVSNRMVVPPPAARPLLQTKLVYWKARRTIVAAPVPATTVPEWANELVEQAVDDFLAKKGLA